MGWWSELWERKRGGGGGWGEIDCWERGEDDLVCKMPFSKYI